MLNISKILYILNDVNFKYWVEIVSIEFLQIYQYA